MSRSTPSVPLPRQWPAHVSTAVLHVVALVRFATANVRGTLALSPLERVRLRSEVKRLRDEIALLQTQLRITNARMARIQPRLRPHYTPQERRDILALRAAHGWSLARSAREFLVCTDTLRHWIHALEGGTTGPLLPAPPPVNRFPDFVREIIATLESMQPTVSSQRIADLLCRAGLHLSASTARRVRLSPQRGSPDGKRTLDRAHEATPATAHPAAPRTVTARYPGHLWHIDLTVMPIFGGLWVPWLPHAVRDLWPWCWHIFVVLDHFSRAVVCAVAFPSKPHADEVCRVLDYAVHCAGDPPKYIVSDQGVQFRSEYKAWCEAHDVLPRFGAVGQHGSIALIERFMRTLKHEGLRRILMPLTIKGINHELALFCRWYNVHRPHRALLGATPAEVRDARLPAHRRNSYEPRPRHPLESKLSARRRIGRVTRVERLELIVTQVEGRKHLPVVELRAAA
jgi:transposase InsO family protein